MVRIAEEIGEQRLQLRRVLYQVLSLEVPQLSLQEEREALWLLPEGYAGEVLAVNIYIT